MDNGALITKVSGKTFLDSKEITPEIIQCVYFFMFSGGQRIDVGRAIHDIYLERTYWDPEDWPSSLPQLSIISLENLRTTDLILKLFSANENVIIPEIKLLYKLALEYDSLDMLDTINPSEDLFGYLDHVFPDSWCYNLPFVVNLYHKLKEKRPFNTIRFKKG